MITIVTSLLLSLPALAQNEVVGIWLTPEGETKVEIYEDGGQYYGKVVWLKTPMNKKGQPPTDKKNPNKALRERHIMGIHLLEGLTYKNNQWSGTIYSPKKGKSLDVALSLNNANELNLTVSVYSFTREQVWTRTTL